MRANLLLSAAVILAACSPSNPAPTEDTTQPTSEPVPVATKEAAPAEPATVQPGDDASVSPGEPVEAIVWGDWTVTSARLSNPDGPVQAYGAEQLSDLRGTRLTIARDEARWSGPATVDDTAFAATCSRPQPEVASGDDISIRCAAGGVFGPGSGTTKWRMVGNDRMVVPWFDGVTLDLVRVR